MLGFVPDSASTPSICPTGPWCSTYTEELARHADIRQTAKHTHIGIRAHGPWLGCNITKKSASIELSGMCRDSGGVLRQEVSRGDSNGDARAGR